LGDLQGAPDLVILDITLPKKNGHEVLHYIKNHESCRHIPTIMLTTSSNSKDIMLAYKNYANCYITKRVDVLDFFKDIKKIEDFWINIASMPLG
jgi:CheY-like chemotaxis protein